MPIYEYHCPRCQNEFELLLRGQQQPACPQCGNEQLQRLPSVPAAHTRSSLPICPPPSTGGCGLPQCGQGRCQFEP